ncbi:MAG: antitoxin Xre/MbcA/ParS toxin-binding domain-containing protein [Balneolaceae bacterium]
MTKKNSRYNYKSPEAKDRNIINEPYIAWDLPEAASKISYGLSTDVLNTIRRRLLLSNRELADILMISPRTLDRRKKEEKLPPDESERSYRIVRLTDLAIEILGTMDRSATWFKQPNYTLDNQKPVELVKTEPGARLVERTLGQIRHGITA